MALLTKPNPRQISLIEVLAEAFPGVKASAAGDGTDYEYLRADPSGDPLPPLEAIQAKQLELSRLHMWRLIQAERDARKANGVKVGPNWFHSDDGSRIQQLALVIFGANLPQGIMWKTLDGAFVPMTNTLAVQIFQASAAQDTAIFTVAEQHKAGMMYSHTPWTYDFSSMWPATYEGSQLN